MDLGIDDSDPFGVAALFMAQSMAHRFDCEPQVSQLLADLLALPTPILPGENAAEVVEPIDRLLDWIEAEPGSLELVEALAELGVETPPNTPTSEQLYRSVMWTVMRRNPVVHTPTLLMALSNATPGARTKSTAWPRHEFFSAVLVLLYLGGDDGRRELVELTDAARDLGYHDLVPVLEFYLDHHHSPHPRHSRS